MTSTAQHLHPVFDYSRPAAELILSPVRERLASEPAGIRMRLQLRGAGQSGRSTDRYSQRPTGHRLPRRADSSIAVNV